MVRLTELDPRWWGVTGRHGQGMHFDCPVCKQEKIGVAFSNPLDGGPIAPDCKYYWKRDGETFEDITLHPSVDASEIGHWHGLIQRGGIIMAEGTKCRAVLDVQNGEVLLTG